jgi:hypothetical protein
MPPGETSTATESSAKRDLASWWKNFKKGTNKRDEERRMRFVSCNLEIISNCALELPGNEVEPYGIFGVPLQTSVRYANVAISLNDANGQNYIYGYVPIIVAKCGVFLKEKGTTTSC